MRIQMKQSANICRDPEILFPTISDTSVFRQSLRNKAEVETFFRKFKKELSLMPAQGSASQVTNGTTLVAADPDPEAKAKAVAEAQAKAKAVAEAIAEAKPKPKPKAKAKANAKAESPTEFVYFPCLPLETKVMILMIHLAQESEVICPFYCHGYKPDDTAFNRTEQAAMSNYPVPAIWHKERPNVNLAVLEVNKHLRTLASPLFWCNRYFLFNDARSCLWFFKKIGTSNMRQVHHAIFNLSSGFFLSKEYRSKSDICEERRWCEVFEFLKPSHQLWKCIIRFYDWNDLFSRKNLGDKDKVQMTKGRLDLVAILAGFRGVGKVIVENDKCDFLAEANRFQLARLMTATEKQQPLGSHNMEISVAKTLFKNEYS